MLPVLGSDLWLGQTWSADSRPLHRKPLHRGVQNGTFLEIGRAGFSECLAQELLPLLSPDT